MHQEEKRKHNEDGAHPSEDPAKPDLSTNLWNYCANKPLKATSPVMCMFPHKD